MALSEEEAKALAGAIGDVAKHYDFIVDEKTAAWANLFMIAGATYGTRIGAYYIRRARERKERTAKVTPMRPAE